MSEEAPANPPPDDPENSLPGSLTAEGVFERYGLRVYNLARRMLDNAADAEDVTQDVLLQVVRKLDTFRGQSDFATWLHRVTVNAALVHRRKAAPRKARTARGPLEFFMDRGSPLPGRPPASVTPDRQVQTRELQGKIEAAVARLPEAYRDVFVLADVEDLSNAEVAQSLGLSVAAVKSRLHRARLLLRDLLAPYLGGGVIS